MLELNGLNIGDKNLEELVALKNLRRLWLARTKVTDKGLQAFKKMDQLEFLGLSGSPVTDAGVDDLKKARPKLEVFK